MYCVNCGKEVGDDGAFCPNCGSVVGTGEKRKPKVALSIKSIVVILGVVAVAALLFKISYANDVNASPENVAKAAVVSEYEADIDLMVKCFPDFTIRELALEYGLSPNASRSEVKKKIKEEYRFANSCTVSDIKTEVLNLYDVDEFTFFKELYDDMTDKEYEAITEVAKVKVTFRIDEENESAQATCIKIKGKWYLLRRR